MTFDQAHAGLRGALAARGYTTPTPVQAAILAADAAGRDLLVSAQTGSGKTVAFGLALAPTLLGEAARFDRGPVRGLVIAPTRELALQVRRELAWLYAPTGASIVACVGGMDIRREAWELSKGATIVVGTPGRLRDHLERQHVSFAEVQAVVLDEADEMLDLGFKEELEALLDATPATRRTLMFSATLPRPILSLAKQYTKDALRITIGDEGTPHGDIDYQAMLIAPRERELAVVNVLRLAEAAGALVFCATREGVTHLAANLNERGFAVVALSGELSQNERTRALQSLRDGRARVCIATDVAARGLDLPDLGLVVHADLPQNAQVLQHRSGRTGRAGRKGTAIMLAPVPARRRVEQLFSMAGITPRWVAPPTAEQIRAADQTRLAAELATMAADATDDDRAAARALLAERPAEELALVLIRWHRSRLPAPEELSIITPPPPRGARPSHGAAARGPSAEGAGDAGPPVWFRIDVGRMRQADPRWLIPVICTRGGITKADIGAIRVLSHETRFEIAAYAADRFELSAARPPKDHPDRTVRTAKISRAPGPPSRDAPSDREDRDPADAHRHPLRRSGPPPSRPRPLAPRRPR
ncbi:MAG TPA: DEAD/DEAH box helicase [Kofleriaceae bacterium]|nr:DEAD/DEAH box helicase [Kofleriaceae bacterium]